MEAGISKIRLYEFIRLSELSRLTFPASFVSKEEYLSTTEMLSIYQITGQGKQTRSRLLEALQQKDGLTRNELAQQSGLSYEQVRNQTQNLICEGEIVPRTVSGKRRYYVRIFAGLLAVWLPFWSVSIDDDDAVSVPGQDLSDS